MRRKRPIVSEDMEATPIPVGGTFVIGDTLTGRLTGNAYNGSAVLDIYRKDAEEGVTHMTIDNFAEIVRLAQNLSEFVEKMVSKGAH